MANICIAAAIVNARLRMHRKFKSFYILHKFRLPEQIHTKPYRKLKKTKFYIVVTLLFVSWITFK